MTTGEGFQKVDCQGYGQVGEYDGEDMGGIAARVPINHLFDKINGCL